MIAAACQMIAIEGDWRWYAWARSIITGCESGRSH
jgi:hypothetical protein